MFLRKYFTTVTESTVTDSGRRGPGERLGSQPEIKNDSPFAPALGYDIIPCASIQRLGITSQTYFAKYLCYYYNF